MLGYCRYVRHLAAATFLAVLLAIVPSGAASPPARAFDGCTLADVRAITCRLQAGETVEGTLTASASEATYRVDALAADAVLDVSLEAVGSGLRASVLDWRGQQIGSGVEADDDTEAHLSVRLPLPGVYGIRVSGDVPAEGAGYRLTAKLTYPGVAPTPVWPRALASPDGPLTGERRVIRVPRGGTPAGGVAAGRTLGAPPDGIFSDFTLVADVQFERVPGPSALTVRFRFEPEAGGGTGYVLSVDPFGGTVTLDTFEEGQRHSIVGHAPLPALPTPDGPNRLVLTADGPKIRATLDGLLLVDVVDGRFTKGLIATGAVTWSDPVSVTFDHIQVTSLPR